MWWPFKRKFWVVEMVVPTLRGRFSIQLARTSFGASGQWGVARVVDGPFRSREDAIVSLVRMRQVFAEGV